MMVTNGNLGPTLKSYVDRIERLLEEKKAISDDITEIYKEAKGRELDVDTLKDIIKLRKMDSDKRAEREFTRDVYLRAMGLLD